MDNNNQNGFTLIELLVAFAVAAILLGIGIPSFTGAIKNSQVSTDYNELTQALFIARSEAVKSTEFVTVCPKASVGATQCAAHLDAWNNGWLVFVDPTSSVNPNEAFAKIDPADEIISIHPKPRSDNSIAAIGSTDRTSATANQRGYIRYGTTGVANWASGSFTLCSDEEVERSRVINIAPTGDVRPGRKSGSEYPRDVFNAEACI